MLLGEYVGDERIPNFWEDYDPVDCVGLAAVSYCQNVTVDCGNDILL